MDFAYSERCRELQARLLAFMDEHIYPNEAAFNEEIAANARERGTRWLPLELIERLKPLAREAGLWNLFLPRSSRAPEEIGRAHV